MSSDPMTTLTVYFCGSGNNMSEDKSQKHVVPYLISIARNRHIGFDGPGGNRKGTKMYEMNDNNTFKVDSQGNKQRIPGAKGKTGIGALTGAGANATIYGAVEWIKNRLDAGYPVTTINLCGHSRGSVSAVITAWILDRLYRVSRPNLRVNMFLFDPVAGARHNFNGSYAVGSQRITVKMDELPLIVKNFRGLMAANMAGNMKKFGMNLGPKDDGFQSTMPKNSYNGCETYDVVVMPGGHNSATKYNLNNGGSWIGRIALAMATGFLRDHGSAFSANHDLNWNQICEGYAFARTPTNRQLQGKDQNEDLDMEFFGNDNTALTSNHRGVSVNEFSSVFGHDLYVNKHHLTAFQRALPHVAPFVARGEKISVEMMKRIALTMPNTARLLARAGMVGHQGAKENTRLSQIQN